LLGSSLILVMGMYYGQMTGLYVGLAATLTGLVVQLGWLWKHRHRGPDELESNKGKVRKA